MPAPSGYIASAIVVFLNSLHIYIAQLLIDQTACSLSDIKQFNPHGTV